LSAAWSAGAAWSESLRRCGLDPEIKPEVIPSPSHPAARPCVVASGRLALEGVRSGLGGQPPSGGFGGGLASCVRKLWRPRVLDSTSSFSRWLAPTAGVFLPVCVLCDALRHELGPPHEEGFPVPVDEVAAVHGLASVEPPAPRASQQGGWRGPPKSMPPKKTREGFRSTSRHVFQEKISSISSPGAPGG